MDVYVVVECMGDEELDDIVIKVSISAYHAVAAAYSNMGEDDRNELFVSTYNWNHNRPKSIGRLEIIRLIEVGGIGSGGETEVHLTSMRRGKSVTIWRLPIT